MTNQAKSELLRAIMKLEMFLTGFLILDKEKDLMKKLFRNTESMKAIINKN